MQQITITVKALISMAHPRIMAHGIVKEGRIQ